MELRHLRCFITVAEELHFSRAAERLNIEQSPLSRTIKQLENNLGVRLLERTPRGARLTWAGQVFLEDARRVLLAFDQAKANAKSASNGYRGVLRIALSDGIAQSRLTTLLALCREEEPDVEIRLFEIPFAQQLKGLRSNLYDAGFTLADEVENGFVTTHAWSDPVVVAIPTRHPLLSYKRVTLEQAVNYPLVLCHPEACEGCSRQVERLLRMVDKQPIVAERVTTHELMMALVAAGYGVGFSSAAHVASLHNMAVVARPLAESSVALDTYLLHNDGERSEQLDNFIGRINRISQIGPFDGWAAGRRR